MVTNPTATIMKFQNFLRVPGLRRGGLRSHGGLEDVRKAMKARKGAQNCSVVVDCCDLSLR